MDFFFERSSEFDSFHGKDSPTARIAGGEEGLSLVLWQRVAILSAALITLFNSYL